MPHPGDLHDGSAHPLTAQSDSRSRNLRLIFTACSLIFPPRIVLQSPRCCATRLPPTASPCRRASRACALILNKLDPPTPKPAPFPPLKPPRQPSMLMAKIAICTPLGLRSGRTRAAGEHQVLRPARSLHPGWGAAGPALARQQPCASRAGARVHRGDVNN